jgi:hypothetical protein
MDEKHGARCKGLNVCLSIPENIIHYEVIYACNPLPNKSITNLLAIPITIVTAASFSNPATIPASSIFCRHNLTQALLLATCPPTAQLFKVIEIWAVTAWRKR